MQAEPVKPAVEKIARECEKAGATKWEVIRIIKELGAGEKTGEQKLEEKALAVLRTVNPEAAKIFESFARLHVHNSKQSIERFDRGNIVKSLLQETHTNRAIAEKIGAEVEDKIKDLKIKHLTTTLIREMVNAKLLEYGLEELRKKYARLGMPVADIEREIEKGLFINKEVLTEYSLLVAIPEELSEHHFNADLHICKVEDFCTRPYGAIIEPQSQWKEEEITPNLLELVAEAKKIFSVPPTIESVNFFFSSALKDSGEKKIKKDCLQAMECIASANREDGGMPAIRLDFFVPEQFEKNSSRKQNAVDLANAIIGYFAKNCNNKKIIVAVDSKYCLKALSEESLATELYFANCEKEELSAIGTQTAFPTRQAKGILGIIGLNAQKLAFENTGRQGAFEEEFLEKALAAKKIMEIKKARLEKRQYLKSNRIAALQELKPMLGLHNLQEAIATVLEKKEFDKECTAFSEKLLKKTRETLGEEWLISRFYEQEGKKRFESFNEKEFRQQMEGITAGKSNPVARNLKELEELVESGEQLILLKQEQQQGKTAAA